ncbi:penicillin-binding protein 1B [Marinobacter sp.]|uniref:penicillin-binding protein 1B n=1 Tax=Marinobacter sp. TaxID=50741 RepID=UPI003A914395
MSGTEAVPHSTRNPSRGRFASFWKWVFAALLVGVALLAGVAVYLDSVVQEKFSGKRWTVPAKVYARPLELFEGQTLKLEDLVTELEALGYSREEIVDRPGEMLVAHNVVELQSRGFQFYEGAEPARRLRVRFSGDTVVELSQPGADVVAVARLEPILIGGIYPAHNEDRILIQIEQVPRYLVETLVAVEDQAFFDHWGVSPQSIARAIWVNLSAGELLQGGSTLTQQLVKNFYLTNDRTLARKATEAIMAVLLELHYEKSGILEAYLNEVFLGQDGSRAIHGFGLASQYFFNQPLAELKLHQIALLVGMVKGPTYYNPRRHPERALERRNLVIDVLAEQGAITPELAAAVKQKPLDVSRHGRMADSSYPAFLDLVKRQLREDYREQDLTEEGLRVFTSFDPIAQSNAEQAMSQTLKRLGKNKGAEDIEGAMVVTNPTTGEVQALLGSRDAGFAGFNRALDAVRPIGSLIKPAVYLTALEKPSLYTLTTVINDEPLTVELDDGQVWTPRNYGRQAHGKVLLYEGLVHSYNLATANLGLEIGVAQVLETLERLGIERDWPVFPSMLLGAGALTPVEVAGMYQTLANGGFNTPLRAIRSVLNAQGEPLKRYPFKVEQRFDPGAIYLTQFGLQRVMREGTGRSAYDQLPDTLSLAGKTGTTNDSRDSWFAGFSQDLLAVVWLGRDDNGKTPLTGATGALQVWTDFMDRADPSALEPPTPTSVHHVWIDTQTGLQTDRRCPAAMHIPYIRGTEPPAGPGCGLSAPAESMMDWVKGWVQ